MDQECSCFTVLTGGLLAPVDLEDHGCTGGSRPMANVVVLRSLSSRSDWFAQGCSCIRRLYPQTLKKQSRKTLKEEQAFLYFPHRYRSPPEKEKQKLLSAPRPYASARNSQFHRVLSPWLWGGRAHPPFSSNSFTCCKVLVLPSLVFSSPPLSGAFSCSLCLTHHSTQCSPLRYEALQLLRQVSPTPLLFSQRCQMGRRVYFSLSAFLRFLWPFSRLYVPSEAEREPA